MKNATEVVVIHCLGVQVNHLSQDSEAQASLLGFNGLPLKVNDVSQKLDFSFFFSVESTKDGLQENQPALNRPLI